MYTNDSKSIRIAIVGAFAAGLLQIAHALGLGPITVNSHIGEPLQATINLSGLDEVKQGNTVVSVAGSDAYRSRGIEKLPSHDQLAFSLQSSASGYYINITTPTAVREPFITFVLSVKYDGKETLREYTVFLDPPSDSLPVPAIAPSTSLEANSANTVSNTPETIELLVDQPATVDATGWQGKAAEPVASTRKAEAEDWQGRSYGPVKKGETLFSIAEKVRPSPEYPIRSIMHQIYQSNPRAFNSKQLGSLMAGYRLAIPVFTKEPIELPEQTVKSSAPVSKPVSTKKSETAVTEVDIQNQEVENADENVVSNDHSDMKVAAAEANEHIDSASVEANQEQEVATPNLQTTLEDTEQDLGDKTQDLGDSGNEQRESFELAQTEQSSSDVSVTTEQLDASTNEESIGAVNSATDVAVADTSKDEMGTEQAIKNTASSVEATSTDLVVQEEPVVERENPQSFLNTTYAFLPMWQWLVISVLLLGLIALLLFRLRKKHAIDEFATLDEAEMDAVLAKINALENEGNLENIGETPSLSENVMHDDLVESKESEQTNWDGDIVFDELEDFEPNQDAENEEQIASIEVDHVPAAEKEDYDFFLAGDEDKINAEDSGIDDFDLDFGELEGSQVTASKVDTLPEQDDLDFFISEDILDEESLVSATESSFSSDDEIYPNKESGSGLDEELNLDELFINDDNIEAGDVIAGDENATELTLGAEEPVADEIQNGSEASSEQLTSVNPEEMEINLDLAVSFIATGHGERAVIWLEEVLEVGTDEQKERAQVLMDKVRGA